MSEIATGNRRAVRSYRQTIDAPPEAVFPLLCPVREAEWLDGWTFTMLHSVSGLVEEGAVFTTPDEGEAETVWIVSRHDAARGLVEFVRVTPGSRICLQKIAVSPSGDGRSHVDVSYTYTSLAPAGDEFLAAWTEEAFLAGVTFWEASMNHFLASGRKLGRRSG